MIPPRQIAAEPRQEQPHVHSPGILSMMREVLHMLGDIDAEYEIRLDRAEHSAADPELKAHIKRKIRTAHRERREPYVELLASLRQRQQGLSPKT
ncbi:hypothetical protein [Microvirga makkahensis]|uniref:Uncharacterized protein n=1 Tax=Microvirga makkahensis TaxID=1128670 RepID=A0A7X3MTE0_9HYPH|nr:hypothetical protein [Microvirga makkahensis]MXQ12718.1 hypothetical protein [Microvirga makkahensis]